MRQIDHKKISLPLTSEEAANKKPITNAILTQAISDISLDILDEETANALYALDLGDFSTFRKLKLTPAVQNSLLMNLIMNLMLMEKSGSITHQWLSPAEFKKI